MSEEPEASVTICWECEAETDQAITVDIPTQAERIARLPLCPRCYRTCYLRLASDLLTDRQI